MTTVDRRPTTIASMVTAKKPKGGLEDVVATSSAICYLDGDRGVLAYCGYDIHDLARFATFEEVCYLLWHRRLPTRAELGDLQSQLAAARPLPEAIIRLMRTLPPVDGMDALRTLDLGARPLRCRGRRPRRRRRQYRKAVRLTAQIGDHRRDVGPAAGRRRADRARSGDGPRGELPVHADGRASEPDGDPRLRRGADASRRPRAERVDVRRARRRGDADRHLLGGRGRPSARSRGRCTAAPTPR